MKLKCFMPTWLKQQAASVKRDHRKQIKRNESYHNEKKRHVTKHKVVKATQIVAMSNY